MDKERDTKELQPKITKFPIKHFSEEEGCAQNIIGDIKDQITSILSENDTISATDVKKDKIIPLITSFKEEDKEEIQKESFDEKESERNKEDQTQNISEQPSKEDETIRIEKQIKFFSNRKKIKNARKLVLISLLITGLLFFTLQTVWNLNPKSMNQDEISKYTVENFVTSVYSASKLEENPFPKGKRIQVYGPISRIKEGYIYMKSEDKTVEILLSSKTRKKIDFSDLILGKSYKLEASVVDATASDDIISLEEGDFVVEASELSTKEDEEKETSGE